METATFQQLQERVFKLEAELELLRNQPSDSLTIEVLQEFIAKAPYEIHLWQVIRDADGKIVNWKLRNANLRALETWGVDKLDDIIDKTTDIIFPEANPVEQFMPTVEKIFQTDAPTTWEAYFPGTKQTLNMMSMPFGDFFVSTGFDVSHFKETQKALHLAIQKAEGANEAKTQFLANMSHELRTPLNAILGFSQILLTMANREVFPAGVENYFQKIKNSGDLLLQLVENILLVAKIESEEINVSIKTFNILDFFGVLSKTQERALAEKSISLSTEIEADLPETIATDQALLERILLHLINNAIKFSLDGTEINLIAKRNAKMIIIEVRDQGIGIASNKIDTIFELFEQVDGSSTRRYGGTGLGLTLVKRLARVLEGDIEVESKEGKGSVFRVILPLTATGAVQSF